MANVIPTSSKARFLRGEFQAAHTYKGALHTTAWAPTAATANYGTTNEVVGGNYVAGGATLAGYAVTESGTKGVLTFGNVQYVNLTAAFNYFSVYDDSHANKGILAIWDVGAQNVTGITVNINMPTADATTGLLRAA